MMIALGIPISIILLLATLNFIARRKKKAAFVLTLYNFCIKKSVMYICYVSFLSENYNYKLYKQ